MRTMTEEFQSCRDIIVDAFPELKGASFRPLTMGWDSLAIDADDRLIFKFPRGEQAEQALRREAPILSAVRQQLSMTVPELDLIEAPRLFSRHSKIMGEHLVNEQYVKLPAPARVRLAEDLALFYAQLHELDQAAMREVGAVEIGPLQPLESIRSRALPLVPAEHLALCERTIKAFETIGPDPYGPTYGYFDGHGWNMAFDHSTQRINGVYDFSDSGIGPLHQDFIYSSFISPELTCMIADRYGRITGRPMDHERIGILVGMHRLSELAELAEDPQYLPMVCESVISWANNSTG